MKQKSNGDAVLLNLTVPHVAEPLCTLTLLRAVIFPGFPVYWPLDAPSQCSFPQESSGKLCSLPSLELF